MKPINNNNTTPGFRSPQSGFSLIEVLCVMAIIGVLTGVAIPIVKGLDRVSVAKSKRNAQMTVEVSSNLTTLDVAHVLPKSLGGAAATTRLLKAGIVIDKAEMEGAKMGMQNLPADQIEETARYIEVVFDESGLRLQYEPGED